MPGTKTSGAKRALCRHRAGFCAMDRHVCLSAPQFLGPAYLQHFSSGSHRLCPRPASPFEQRVHREESSPWNSPGCFSVRHFLHGESGSHDSIPALSCSPSRACREHSFCLREPRRALPCPCRLSALFPHRVRRGNLLARLCAATLQRKMERQVRFCPHDPSLHRDPRSNGESGSHPCSSHLRPFLGRLLLGQRKSCPCACLSHALGSLHFCNMADPVIA